MKLYVIVFAISALIMSVKSQIPDYIRARLQGIADMDKDGQFTPAEIYTVLQNADANRNRRVTYREWSRFLLGLDNIFSGYEEALFNEFSPRKDQDIIIPNVNKR